MIPRGRSAIPLRWLSAVAAIALVPAVAGCEAGLNAPTLHWHQPTAGTSAIVDNTIRIANMFVLGAAPRFSLAPGRSTGVFFALTNSGAPDALVGMSAPGTALAVRLPNGGIQIGRNAQVRLTGPVPRVVLAGLLRPVRGGSTVRLLLSFRNAGVVVLEVPVMPRSGPYATFAPVTPSPTPTPATTGVPHGSPSPVPTVTPAPAATPSPTAS
ncbi:MAG TPA: hypothetical protein VGS19_22065 [Streptosporangiaceae bacterium]|nr:hypothetical protein [Streptosporangiaceae bacterium]